MMLRELTSKAPVTLASDATIEEAARLMDQYSVGAVIVVDGVRPVGVVTDRDLVVRALARGVRGDGRVDSVMTPGLVSIDADADVRQAIALFASHPFRRLPVVDGDTVIGMVTVDDLVVVLGRQLGDVITGVSAQLLFGHPEPVLPVPRSDRG
jgi:CBS domain-containing protein